MRTLWYVLPLLAMACSDPGPDPPAERPLVAQQDRTDTAIDPITDVLLIAIPDQTSLAGRRVHLDSVTVQTVLGRRTFWAGPDPGKRILVVLQDTAEAGDVQPGQAMMLAGEIKRMPSDVATMREQWSLSEADLATLARQSIYLAADSLRRVR